MYFTLTAESKSATNQKRFYSFPILKTVLSIFACFICTFAEGETNEQDEKKNKHAKTQNFSGTSQRKQNDAVSKLLAGNENFKKNIRKNQNFDEQRKLLAKHQKPHSIIVTCSDSRVSPEIIFDKGLGEVFVVRTAGNVIDSIALGSIEYAAEHLQTDNLIVMGHTSCGAVTAAMDGETTSPYINAILQKISLAVRSAKTKSSGRTQTLHTAIQENIKNQIAFIKESAVIRHLVEHDKLDITGCVYDLESGAVHILQ